MVNIPYVLWPSWVKIWQIMEVLYMKEELLKGLSEEQIAKVKACKNQEEVLALAKCEGIELSEEQLEAVSGGGCTPMAECPNCHTQCRAYTDSFTGRSGVQCPNCGFVLIN